jgi:hypothetical protein
MFKCRFLKCTILIQTYHQGKISKTEQKEPPLQAEAINCTVSVYCKWQIYTGHNVTISVVRILYFPTSGLAVPSHLSQNRFLGFCKHPLPLSVPFCNSFPYKTADINLLNLTVALDGLKQNVRTGDSIRAHSFNTFQPFPHKMLTHISHTSQLQSPGVLS